MKNFIQWLNNLSKDHRNILALGVAVAFFVLVWFMVFPWVVSLSQGWATWLGAGFIILLLITMVVGVTYIREPEPFHKVYNNWRNTKAVRRWARGVHTSENHLTDEVKDGIRSKYPGLF